MPTSALLDLPIASTRGGTGDRTPAFRSRLLDHEVVVATDRPVPAAALEHLVAQLDEQWDVRRRRSDLARISNRPSVMVAVDGRHGRVGLDATAAAATARLTVAVAADLLADFCTGSGASTEYARVGEVRRELGDPVPAWLHQLARGGADSAARRSGPG